MALKEKYTTLEEVPEQYRELYTESDEGECTFSGVEGLVGASGQRKLRDEAGAQRIKQREATKALGLWAKLGESPDSVLELLDSIPELTARAEAAGGDEERLNKTVEARVRQVEGKFGREMEALTATSTGQAELISSYEGNERRAAIERAVAKAMGNTKQGQIRPEAGEDVLMYAALHMETIEERDDHGRLVITDIRSRDGIGVTPGLEADAWLSEMRDKKPHWCVESNGGGAGGSSGRSGAGNNNPWKGSNMTARAQYLKEHGAEKAGQMARAAGTTVSGVPLPSAAAKPYQPRR